MQSKQKGNGEADPCVAGVVEGTRQLLLNQWKALRCATMLHHLLVLHRYISKGGNEKEKKKMIGKAREGENKEEAK